ncbi:4'-phosphopantetheinyl transferase superfamily protein [Bacteroides gallinaceum]|uniref:4'-phosphopantetheinyl transferase family protein n=1 Tax=Bacteroides gallinaceum TaxID=1462571 RepID=UPI0015B2D8E4|nr:4'-phosphopantetheinyl transferase superfamily protein [Bacteroides gallinaceum]MDM8152885.1 4'-phosphopantetheinyl transferase superfamily protein [Bacteroides gallinaceum]
MSLFKSWECEGGRFAVWKVEETAEEMRAALGDALPYDEELSRLRAESRRMEYLAVRVLLKAICGEEKQVCHEPSGKPFLADCSYHLSISHTKGYVAVALHPTAEVGIDIEQVSDRVLKVASRFMSDEELRGETDALKDCHDDTSSATLYYMLLHWSAKETLFKLMDQAEVDFKRHLCMSPFRVYPEGCFAGREYCTPQSKNYLIHYFLHPHFVCTWSVGQENKP